MTIDIWGTFPFKNLKNDGERIGKNKNKNPADSYSDYQTQNQRSLFLPS